MFSSPTPRSDAARAEAVALLQPVVLEGMSLSLLAQRMHWAVRGPSFGPLHALFGEVYSTVAGFVDRLAERMATLGTEDPMGDAAAVTVARLPTVDGLRLCAVLVPALDAFARSVYAAYQRLEEGGFCADSNALQDVLEGVEKLSWMVRSHTIAA